MSPDGAGGGGQCHAGTLVVVDDEDVVAEDMLLKAGQEFLALEDVLVVGVVVDDPDLAGLLLHGNCNVVDDLADNFRAEWVGDEKGILFFFDLIGTGIGVDDLESRCRPGAFLVSLTVLPGDGTEVRGELHPSYCPKA